MTRLIKVILLCWIAPLFPLRSSAAAISVVESVLQHGFPVQPDALAKTTDALLNEYENHKNVTSLIFYSYGMLRLASHFEAVNDYVKASEYAKLGFFYLDETADLHENNPRVRYLRARVDAFLPASLGRCVVTLSDTSMLLKEKGFFDNNIAEYINYMRYRALLNCQQAQQAAALWAAMKNNGQSKLLSLDLNTTPEWDINEITQVIAPLMKGE